MTDNKQRVFEIILAQYEGAVERWYKGDPFGMLELMDEDMTYFSPFANHRVDGKSAIEALFAPIAGQIQVPGFEILDPDLKLGEGTAVLTFHLHELSEDGVLTAGWKVTEIYRHVGDKWRVFHSHFTPYGDDQ
ncbi:MAG TPA: DUF4440 domain-containing protein [candidate division Zixibacteria bacterium]|nr:DUF4440 domain-containing protein [candidate division Zixibacteria bacterium]